MATQIYGAFGVKRLTDKFTMTHAVGFGTNTMSLIEHSDGNSVIIDGVCKNSSYPYPPLYV